jgi:hypothetical protein
VNLISTETKEDGTKGYDIRGLAVEYLLISIKKMNMTVEFLQPSLDLYFEKAMAEATKLTAGISDVLVATVPLLSITVSGMTVTSIPYISDAMKWFVPCPKPISRVEKILAVFDGWRSAL